MKAEHSPSNQPKLKVKFQLKAIVLVLSVISLSWFFEAVRQIKQAVNFEHVSLLILSSLSTVLLVWVQAFWIYIEEKSKGTLGRKVAHFDRLEDWLRPNKTPIVLNRDEKA